jgi:hypothetical protein
MGFRLRFELLSAMLLLHRVLLFFSFFLFRFRLALHPHLAQAAAAPPWLAKLDKSYSKGDIEKTCQNIYNWNHGSRGYGSGGLYGYNTANGPSLKKGNCGDIAFAANNVGFIILGAIPSFCINDDFPKCASNIVTDDLWGTTFE